MPRRAPLTLAALLAATAVHAQSGELDAALAQATVLASQQRPGDAAAVLAPFAARYPDDHALALRLGWLLANTGDHRAARAHYTRALARSAGESRDARLGLAWSALRSDDPATATMEFETLLALDPAHGSAREGLALARAALPRAVRAWASLWTSAQLYASGFGGSVGAAVTLRQPRFSLTLAGRVSDETRMTSLSDSMTFATNDSIRGALSVSGRVPLGRGLALAPSYEWLRLETTDGANADAHFITLGLTGAW